MFRIAERAKALEGQWIPPPPDEEDTPAGQAGYFLQIGLPRFADALDSVTSESDRPVLVSDLSGKVRFIFSPLLFASHVSLSHSHLPFLSPAFSPCPLLQVLTYFEYRDCNMHCYARPKDIEPNVLRKGLMGALRSSISASPHSARALSSVHLLTGCTWLPMCRERALIDRCTVRVFPALCVPIGTASRLCST